MYALLNVITGIFVENAVGNAKKDKQDEMASLVRHFLKIVSGENEGNEGVITYEDFRNHVKSPWMQQYFEYIDVDPSDAEFLFQLLDIDGNGEVGADEFLDGCMRCSGSARSLDLRQLTHEYRKNTRKSFAMHKSLEKKLDMSLDDLAGSDGQRGSRRREGSRSRERERRGGKGKGKGRGRIAPEDKALQNTKCFFNDQGDLVVRLYDTEVVILREKLAAAAEEKTVEAVEAASSDPVDASKPAPEVAKPAEAETKADAPEAETKVDASEDASKAAPEEAKAAEPAALAGTEGASEPQADAEKKAEDKPAEAEAKPAEAETAKAVEPDEAKPDAGPAEKASEETNEKPAENASGSAEPGDAAKPVEESSAKSAPNPPVVMITGPCSTTRSPLALTASTPVTSTPSVLPAETKATLLAPAPLSASALRTSGTCPSSTSSAMPSGSTSSRGAEAGPTAGAETSSLCALIGPSIAGTGSPAISRAIIGASSCRRASSSCSGFQSNRISGKL